MKKLNYLYLLLFLLVVGIGVAVRVLHFPEIPPGLNQDEANSAYETFSLLKSGKDKWGNVYPSYFPSWGSGQNVLLAYLSIPAVWLFGLNIFSTRLVPLLLGLLALPLFYYCLRPLGRYAAFLGLFLLCVAPWHFMLSRWALESNLLPFFMLLGCTLLSRALITRKKSWIIPSLLPFALALYAYATSIAVLPVFFGLLLLLHFKSFYAQWASWLAAFGLFLFVSFPFFIFFLENYVLGHNMPWTDQLPFATPICPSNRVSPTTEAGLDVFRRNITFLTAGCDDGTSYNMMEGFPVLFHLVIPVFFIGLAVGGWKYIQQKRKRVVLSPAGIVCSVFAAWAIASLSLLGQFTLNINRFNHFFLPCIALAVWIMAYFSDKAPAARLRYSIKAVFIMFFALEGGAAVKHYFSEYPKNRIRSDFNTGLREAFLSVDKMPMSQIQITTQMPLPYVYTLFYLQYPPDKFRAEVNYEIADGMYRVNYFGRYVFFDKFLDTARSHGYLSRKDEFKNDEKKIRTVLYTNDFWETGILTNK